MVQDIFGDRFFSAWSVPGRREVNVDPDRLIQTWQSIIVGSSKSWVLFSHGTCVILMAPAEDLAAQAVALLAEWGPVHAGGPAGDFGTVKLTQAPGWVVTGHHNDILTYVAPDELDDENPSDLSVGLLGRAKRGQDAADLEILHVEDRRTAVSRS